MKTGKLAKYYAVITQGIFTTIVLLLAGYFIGRLIDKESAWPPILATIGALCGVGFFIKLVLMLGGEDDGRNS